MTKVLCPPTNTRNHTVRMQRPSSARATARTAVRTAMNARRATGCTARTPRHRTHCPSRPPPPPCPLPGCTAVCSLADTADTMEACLKGHRLQRQKLPDRVCDVCNETVTGCSLSCTKCDWDVCMRCATGLQRTKSGRAVEVKVRWGPVHRWRRKGFPGGRGRRSMTRRRLASTEVSSGAPRAEAILRRLSVVQWVGSATMCVCAHACVSHPPSPPTPAPPCRTGRSS